MKKCEYCGKDFQSKKITKRFCSDKCRVYGWLDKGNKINLKK